MVDNEINPFKIEDDYSTRKPMKEWKCRSTELYSKINQVGEGTFGKVYKAELKQKGEKSQLVALKRILLDNEKEGFPITAIREIMIMKRLNHPNILKLIEVVTSAPNDKNKNRGNVYLVFEYMEHDISGLADLKCNFTISELKCIMYQILKGVLSLHQCNIIHRDIKSANILFNNKGEIKVGDYGLARIINPNSSIAKHYTNRVVTLWYRAPELLLGETNYGFAIDVWSIGCVFSELLTGVPLFRGQKEIEQVEKIFEKCGTPTIETWPGLTKLKKYDSMKPKMTYKSALKLYYNDYPKVDDSAFDLLEKMLQLDPQKRITVKAALEHNFFTTHLPKMCEIKDLPKIDQDSHEYQHRRDMKMNEMYNQPFQQKKDMNIAFHQYPINSNGNSSGNYKNKTNNGNDLLGMKRKLE